MLSPYYTDSAISQLTMKPVTSPYDHSLLKLSPTKQMAIKDIDQGSKSDEDDAYIGY